MLPKLRNELVGITSVTCASTALLLTMLCIVTSITNRRNPPLELLTIETYTLFLITSLVLASVSVVLAGYHAHRTALLVAVTALGMYVLFFLSPLFMLW